GLSGSGRANQARRCDDAAVADSLAVRDAREEDLPRIVAIYNEAIPGRRSTADTEPVSVSDRRGWFHDPPPSGRPLWVAEREAAIVGWLSFQDFYGRPAYGATAELSVYVSGAAQHSGVGRLLPAPPPP